MVRSCTGGANILRGGQRTYQCKTLIGNFVEESYEPSNGGGADGYVGGEIYMSTSRMQMQQGAQNSMKTFGAGLMAKRGNAMKTSNHTNNVLLGGCAKHNAPWMSVTQSAATNMALEFNDKLVMKSNGVSEDALKEHRDRWTKETSIMSKQRYVTEHSLMLSKPVADEFKHDYVRA